MDRLRLSALSEDGLWARGQLDNTNHTTSLDRHSVLELDCPGL